MALTYAKVNIPLRIVQILLSLIVLGLSAAVIDSFNKFVDSHGYALAIVTPSQWAFVLFCAVFSLLSIIVILLGRFNVVKGFNHIYARLTLEVLNSVFLFCAWIAAAATTPTFDCNQAYGDGTYWGTYYKAMATILKDMCILPKAGTAMTTFLWVVWVPTTVFTIIEVVQHVKGKSANTTTDPETGSATSTSTSAPNITNVEPASASVAPAQ